MKRVLTVVLVLLSLVSAVSAETIDLKGMTPEELVSLRDAVNAELIARGFEKEVNVPAGTYVVGKDIPAGEYTISTKAMMLAFTTLDSNGQYDDIHSIMPGTPIGRIQLREGYTVEIVGGTAIFSVYTGLGF